MRTNFKITLLTSVGCFLGNFSISTFSVDFMQFPKCVRSFLRICTFHVMAPILSRGFCFFVAFTEVIARATTYCCRGEYTCMGSNLN